MSGSTIKPTALKPKDKVGLVAPSGRPYNPSQVNHAVRAVEAMGFAPVVGKHVLEVSDHTAGTAEQRAEDFNSFVADSSVSGIFCITGGVGAFSLLEKLDFKGLAKSQKIFVGDQDNNSIALAALVTEDLVTFYGPSLDEVKDKKAMIEFRNAVCRFDEGTEITAVTNFGEPGFCAEYVPVNGMAEGRLVGGNMTVLSSVQGTKYQPNLEGSILFLTDENDRNDVLDRWFTTLYVSGQLQKTKAVIFGSFENCGGKGSINVLSLEDTFGDRLKELRIPSRFNFPIGAGGLNPVIPIGVKVSFDATNGRMTFLESGLDSD